jgi:hypothetical protein
MVEAAVQPLSCHVSRTSCVMTSRCRCAPRRRLRAWTYARNESDNHGEAASITMRFDVHNNSKFTATKHCHTHPTPSALHHCYYGSCATSVNLNFQASDFRSHQQLSLGVGRSPSIHYLTVVGLARLQKRPCKQGHPSVERPRPTPSQAYSYPLLLSAFLAYCRIAHRIHGQTQRHQSCLALLEQSCFCHAVRGRRSTLCRRAFER